MKTCERGDYVVSGYEQTAKYEHGFWLQILGDHARFILDSLAPKEKDAIGEAEYFKNAFDRLLEGVETTNLIHLSERAEGEVKKFREFKLDLIRRHLQGKIVIHLSPSFINHMVNELDEYARILEYLKRREVPPVFHELHHHLIWLLDAAGHAGAIEDNMDHVEKRLKKKSKEYTKHFEEFYLKAIEMTSFLRTNLTSFPALERFNKEAALEIRLFMNFLQELEDLELSAQALGTFAPLMADHMFREECYYLLKLSESAGIEKPDCDPGKPRLKS
jgi:hypothetical protein